MCNSSSITPGLVNPLDKDKNTDTGSLYSRGFPYLPVPFCMEAEPTDWLASENMDPPTSQVAVKGLGQHLQSSSE